MLRRLLLLALLGAAMACSNLAVKSDYDPGVDFSGYRTFDWLEPPVREEPTADPAAEGADPFVQNSLLDGRVRRAVERELEARGYRRPEPGARPGFRLRYRMLLKDRMRITSSGGPYYAGGPSPYVYGGGTYISSVPYQEGTLVIDVIDAESAQIVWRGWAVGPTDDRSYTEAEVGAVVKRILDRFPPEG